MRLARREMLAVSALLLALGTGLVPLGRDAALALPEGDVLMLHEGGREAAAVLRALRARPGQGRSEARRIDVLGRGGLAEAWALVAGARNVTLIALLLPAQALILDMLLYRAGCRIVRTQMRGGLVALQAGL